jgi:hypothetical protein
VSESGGLIILIMTKEKTMRGMETSEFFSVLKMEFIRFTPS